MSFLHYFFKYIFLQKRFAEINFLLMWIIFYVTDYEEMFPMRWV